MDDFFKKPEEQNDKSPLDFFAPTEEQQDEDEPVAEEQPSVQQPFVIPDEEVEEEPRNIDFDAAGYNDFALEQDEDYENTPFHMTEIHRMPLNASRRGFKAFIIALCAIIVLTCCTAGGYLLGQNSRQSNGGNKNDKISLNLEAKPSNKQELTKAQVYEKANPCVVGIQVYNDETAATASGVIFSKDGYIITNDHIYEEIASPKFVIYTADRKEYTASYVAGDTRSDLAVLKIDGVNDLPAAVFGDSDQLYIGENTVAIGRPMSADTDSNLTSGTISLLNRRLSITSSYSLKYIQTDAAINPGNSGGALLNMYGQVIGITSAKIAGQEYEGLGFAIPSAMVKRVVESLIKNGYVTSRAKLGISYYEVGAVSADVDGYPRGLFVNEVDKTSGAYGKLKKGDIITTVNGTEITADDIMLDVIDQSAPGDTLNISGEDQNGNAFTYDIVLGEDKGSSSYTATKQPASDDNSSQNDNSFDFPFGE